MVRLFYLLAAGAIGFTALAGLGDALSHHWGMLGQDAGWGGVG